VTGPATILPEGTDKVGYGGAGRVAVVYERTGPGRAAIREAAELAGAGRELWVVTLAPQVLAARWGRAGGEGPYNVAMREEAEIELKEARELLGSLAGRATFTMLAGRPQPPLVKWVGENGLKLVLLPRHRFTPGGNRYAKGLRAETEAEVRLIG